LVGHLLFGHYWLVIYWWVFIGWSLLVGHLLVGHYFTFIYFQSMETASKEELAELLLRRTQQLKTFEAKLTGKKPCKTICSCAII